MQVEDHRLTWLKNVFFSLVTSLLASLRKSTVRRIFNIAYEAFAINFEIAFSFLKRNSTMASCRRCATQWIRMHWSLQTLSCFSIEESIISSCSLSSWSTSSLQSRSNYRNHSRLGPSSTSVINPFPYLLLSSSSSSRCVVLKLRLCHLPPGRSLSCLAPWRATIRLLFTLFGVHFSELITFLEVSPTPIFPPVGH